MDQADRGHEGPRESAHTQADTSRYDTAFSRNTGRVTKTQQATLRQKRIAIAGLGGGSHLLAHPVVIENFRTQTLNKDTRFSVKGKST